MEYLAVGCRCLVAVVFLVSATSKLAGAAAFPAFVRSMHRMRVLPPGLVRTVAVLVVAAEVGITVLLVVPLRLTGLAGLAVACVLLAGLTVAVIMVVRRGISELCQCFGKASTPLGWQHVARNVVLLGVAGLGLTAATANGSGDPGTLVVTGVTGVVVGAVITRLDDIVALFRPPAAAPVNWAGE